MRRTSNPARRARLVAIIVATALAGVRAAHAADEPPEPRRALYLRYCASCHGPFGGGDGVVAPYLNPRPTDLTQIMKKNNNTFPFQATMKVLDGTNNVRAHGSPEMPVWGEVWREQDGVSPDQRAAAQGKLVLITDYLFTIQDHPPINLKFTLPKDK
jgi:mono/diheme cytochrome c family protein